MIRSVPGGMTEVGLGGDAVLGLMLATAIHRLFGYHFFRKTSRVTSSSSIDSASSFLSRPFSVSSSRNRLASDTVIPPNLLRHK
jgi:hypothetical protein